MLDSAIRKGSFDLDQKQLKHAFSTGRFGNGPRGFSSPLASRARRVDRGSSARRTLHVIASSTPIQQEFQAEIGARRRSLFDPNQFIPDARCELHDESRRNGRDRWWRLKHARQALARVRRACASCSADPHRSIFRTTRPAAARKSDIDAPVIAGGCHAQEPTRQSSERGST